jgi:hypothetical protein
VQLDTERKMGEMRAAHAARTAELERTTGIAERNALIEASTAKRTAAMMRDAAGDLTRNADETSKAVSKIAALEEELAGAFARQYNASMARCTSAEQQACSAREQHREARASLAQAQQRLRQVYGGMAPLCPAADARHDPAPRATVLLMEPRPSAASLSQQQQPRSSGSAVLLNNTQSAFAETAQAVHAFLGPSVHTTPTAGVRAGLLRRDRTASPQPRAPPPQGAAASAAAPPTPSPTSTSSASASLSNSDQQRTNNFFNAVVVRADGMPRDAAETSARESSSSSMALPHRSHSVAVHGNDAAAPR